MSFRELLAADPPKFQSASLPRQLAMDSALQALRLSLSRMTERPPPEGAEEFLRRLRATAAANRWQELSRRDWRYSVQLLWSPADPIGENPNICMRVLNWVMEQASRSTYRLLISAYLSGFRADRPGIHQAAKLLRENIELLPVPWAERHRQYRMFDPDEAARTVAAAILSSDSKPLSLLEEIGLGGGHMGTGLAAETHRSVLETLKANLSQTQPDFRHLDRTIEWSEQNGDITYPQHRTALLDAILSPWANGTNPALDQKEKIASFVLRGFSDPRIDRRHWNGAPETAERVMKRWMTQVALEQFIKILDRTAVERQWQYRNAFWMAYFNKGYVEEAWVLFGPHALNEAKQAFGEDVSFGKLRPGSGVMDDHSVLLLRLRGGLVIADWSHNGTCRGWLDGDMAAPRLYSLEAHRSELVRVAPLSQTHQWGERGTWQRKVASFIAEHTGIRVMHRDYMP